MAQRIRTGLSAEQKAELWRRWKAGESLSDIGRSLGKHAASIHGIVRPKAQRQFILLELTDVFTVKMMHSQSEIHTAP